MELEELKSIWRNSESGFQQKNEKEIASMLKGRSLSIIDKLKRNVWLELIITFVVSVAFIIYALTLPSGALKWTFLSILAMCLAYTFYYVKKLILLNRFNPANENIRANLISLIDNLTNYLNFYKRSYTILYPVYFCVALLFALVEKGADAFFSHLVKPKTVLLLTALAGLFYFLSTVFAKWVLKKLYGNHLEKLKSLLSDIHG